MLDLSGSLGSRVGDPELRPDGVHIATEDMFELYEEGLGDELVRTYERWRSRDAGPED